MHADGVAALHHLFYIRRKLKLFIELDSNEFYGKIMKSFS